jgi:hypothetical protein
MRVSNPDDTSHNAEHRSITGAGGYRLDASRNMWEGSGLKTDSANTDVAWCHGRASFPVYPIMTIFTELIVFNNKILTSARNGDLIMWDLNKSGPSKFGEDCSGLPKAYLLRRRTQGKRPHAIRSQTCGLSHRTPLLHYRICRRRSARLGLLFSSFSSLLFMSACVGHPGYAKVDNADTPRDVCAGCCLLSKPLAASTGRCWIGQWEHIPVIFMNQPLLLVCSLSLQLGVADGSARTLGSSSRRPHRQRYFPRLVSA